MATLRRWSVACAAALALFCSLSVANAQATGLNAVTEHAPVWLMGEIHDSPQAHLLRPHAALGPVLIAGNGHVRRNAGVPCGTAR